MRAAVLHAYEGVPEPSTFDDPPAGRSADVVSVEVGGLNPVDLRIAAGNYPLERREPPYVPGKEGVGRLEDGSRVYFDTTVAPFGAYAERALIEPGSGFAVPEELDAGVAVALGVAGLAAWLGLEWRGGLQPGETVLVLGASGVVGTIGVQVARILGAGRVVAAARSEAGLERARELGADATVRLDGSDDVPAALREAAGGGVDVTLDPLWGEPAAAAMSSANPFARHVAIGQSAAAELSVPCILVRSTPLSVIGHTNYAAEPERRRAAFQRMAGHAAAGEIRVDVERVPLDDVGDAWRRQSESPNRKLVIVP